MSCSMGRKNVACSKLLLFEINFEISYWRKFLKYLIILVNIVHMECLWSKTYSWACVINWKSTILFRLNSPMVGQTSPLDGTYHEICLMKRKCDRILSEISINRCDISGDSHNEIRLMDAMTAINITRKIIFNFLLLKTIKNSILLIAGTKKVTACSDEWRSIKNENITLGYLKDTRQLFVTKNSSKHTYEITYIFLVVE